MNSVSDRSDEQAMPSDNELEVRALYRHVLDCWNRRSPAEFAALFEPDAYLVGFDGSPMEGPLQIETELRQIFTDHPTAAYVGKVRGVRFLTPDVALLRAVSGMVPPGHQDLNPAVNAMQTLVAVRRKVGWRVTLYQNTPAQFHGRPELAEQLTNELRSLL